MELLSTLIDKLPVPVPKYTLKASHQSVSQVVNQAEERILNTLPLVIEIKKLKLRVKVVRSRQVVAKKSSLARVFF